MEILAFRDSITGTDPSLHAAVTLSMDIIARALHVYARKPAPSSTDITPELIFSFNGGKDSTVLLHLVRAVIAEQSMARKEELPHDDSALSGVVPVVYFACQNEFPEVTTFMEECASRYGFKIQYVPPFKEGLSELIAKGARAVLIGQRSTDPDGPTLQHFTPTNLNWPPIMRVCPILNWSYQLIWRFLKGAKVSYCSLYDAGYTSLGSTTNSVPNPLLRIANTDGTTSCDKYHPASHLTEDKYERLGRNVKNGAVGHLDGAEACVDRSVSIIAVLPEKHDNITSLTSSLASSLASLEFKDRRIEDIHFVRQTEAALVRSITSAAQSSGIVVVVAVDGVRSDKCTVCTALSKVFPCSLKPLVFIGKTDAERVSYEVPCGPDSSVVCGGAAVPVGDSVLADEGNAWWLKVRNVYVALAALDGVVERWALLAPAFS